LRITFTTVTMKDVDSLTQNFQQLKQRNDNNDSRLQNILKKYNIPDGDSAEAQGAPKISPNNCGKQNFDTYLEEILNRKKMHDFRDKYANNFDITNQGCLTKDQGVDNLRQIDSLARAKALVSDIKARVSKDDGPQNPKNDQSKLNNDWGKQSVVSSKRNSVQKKIEIPQKKFQRDQDLNALAKAMHDLQENPFQKKPFDNVKADIKKMRDASPYRQKFLSHETKTAPQNPPHKKRSTNLNLTLKNLQLHYIHPTETSTNDLLLSHDLPRRSRSHSQPTPPKFSFFLSEIILPRTKKFHKTFTPYKNDSSLQPQKDSLPSKHSNIKFDLRPSKIFSQ
jgi:hypothetical protein